MCQSVIAIILVSIAILGLSELFSTLILVFLYLSCQGFIFPNSAALSMAPFGHNAGNASALMGFIQMSLGAFMSAMVSLLHNGTTVTMTGVMAFCSVLASLIFAISKICM